MPADPRALLARVPGCARLPTAELAALAALSREERYPAGARLVAEGAPAPDWYAVLATGAVQISRLDGRADEVLERLTAGDVLDPGTPGLPAACSMLAIEETQCVLVPQSAVAERRGSRSGDSAAGYRGGLALFVRRAGDLVKGPPVTCRRDTTVAEAARLMTGRGVGSVAVVDGDGVPVGIVTDRDLRAKVLAAGLSGGVEVATVMSTPLLSIDPGCPALDALLEMTRRGIHHLGVVAAGRLAGMVSSHDIILVQGAHPVALIREISAQPSLEGLEAAAPRVLSVVRWLAEEGASAYDIGRIVAELNDRLVHRALALAVASAEAEGHGCPPVPYAWLVAGSEGRREQTLKTDQDNGLVYQDPPGELAATASSYFGRLAGTMGAALARLGFPPCEGGFMASNPRWCQPESKWRADFAAWMETPHPERVLRASLFFDLRPLGGEEGLGQALGDWICERAPTQTLFLRHMAKAALERQAPLGFFGGFVVERSGAHKGRLDLKARGILPMTQALRVYALSLGVRETNTVDRLLAAGRRGVFTTAEVADLRDGYEIISRLRLNHQLACLDAGGAPDNFIDPASLGKADRMLLREAFRAVAHLQRAIEDRFRTEMVT